MNNDLKPVQSCEDEIDFYELYLILKKRLTLILALIVGSVLVAGIFLMLMRPIYEGTSIVRLPLIDNKANADSQHSPQLLFSIQESSQFLSAVKGLKTDAGALLLPGQVISAELKPIKDQPNVAQLVVKAHDPASVPDISAAVVKGLNENPFVAKQLGEERQTLLQLKTFIEKDLAEAVKIRQRVVAGIERGNISFNPLDMDNKILEMRMRLRGVEKELLREQGFTVVVPAQVPDAPVKPKKKLILALAAVTSLFAGIFAAFFLEWLEKAKAQSIGKPAVDTL